MHELAIATQIVDIALNRAEEVGASRIVSVRVKIGQFTAVEPDSLRFCFAALTGATAADGAELQIQQVPLTAECAICRRSFAPEDMRFTCPECGSREVAITGGRELDVESMEVE